MEQCDTTAFSQWLTRGRTLRLASRSPRRLHLLRHLGLEPEVCPVDADESRLAGESVANYVERLARDKARAALTPGVGLCLGADTTVALGEEELGKPRDAAEAAAMLQRLAGREHRVFTGVAVARGADGHMESLVVISRVWIKNLDAEELALYVASGEPMDKAGAYGLQGLGSFLVARIDGSSTGVAGLPLRETAELLRRL
ncbi:MAG: Maf family nucleotide pyrophosphatase [Magnetococcus sp. WYHC-3]